MNLLDEARWVTEESLLFADDTSPFRATVTPAADRLLLVAGENASGKSLLFRILAARAAQSGATPITLSIRERSGAGVEEMSRMRQVFLFGDETQQSTGATSVRAIAAAFSNLDRPDGSLLGLDEPELGLSDGYAHALGRYIGEQARRTPDACAGVVVVTHSRTLATGLIDGYGQAPSFVAVGDTPADLGRWIAEPEHRTVEELLALPEVGLERLRRAADLMRAS